MRALARVAGGGAVAIAVALCARGRRAGRLDVARSDPSGTFARARTLRLALEDVADARGRDAVRFFVDDVSGGWVGGKAATALLATASREALTRARERLERSLADDACATVIDCASNALREMDADEARGTLQRAIATHFSRCSDGATVVLHDVANADPAHLPALLPALSENGAYFDRGRAVPTTAGAFVLLAELPHVQASVGDEKAYTNAAKRAFLETMRARSGGDADGTAHALRRRIDVAIPIDPA